MQTTEEVNINKINNLLETLFDSEDDKGRALRMGASEIAILSSLEARSILPYSKASALSILPLLVVPREQLRKARGKDQQLLVVAVPEENPHEALSALRLLEGTLVRAIQVPRENLQKAIFTAYRGDERELIARIGLMEAAVSLPKEKNEPRPKEVSELLQILFDFAIARKASDVHILPSEDKVLLKFRINGELLSSKTPLCPQSRFREVVTRLKVLASIDLTTTKNAHDGAFSVPTPSGTVRIRINIIPSYHGDKIALRFMKNERFTLPQLGFLPNVVDSLKGIAEKRSGLLLLAGATGSGKSATMYSMMRLLSERGAHVASIEDPVEQLVAEATQVGVRSEDSLSFESALRSLLRQDPDVLCVGEIREKSVAELALSASLSGHLTIATIHGGSVIEVLLRLTQMGLSRHDLAETLSGIIIQSLHPTLCPRCKEIDLVSSASLGIDTFQRVGCHHCAYTGITGQRLCAESLFPTELFRTHFRNLQLPISESALQFSSPEFCSMKEHYYELVREGVIAARDKV